MVAQERTTFLGRHPRATQGTFALILFAGVPVLAAAQPATGGSISGYVRDTQTRVVDGATVAAVNPATTARRVVRTDANGYYRIPLLSPATYTVTAAQDGFALTTRGGVVVREGLNLGIDLILRPGVVSDVVTVTAEPPMLERKTAIQAVNIAGELPQSLPLSSLRTWSDFLLLTPGMVTTQSRLQTYAFRGTSHASGVFVVDGADATSVLQGSTLFAQFGSDTFSDIQVKTGAVDAASPLGLGPVVTIATHSGTNRLRGSAEYVHQPKAWNDSNTPSGQDFTIAMAQVDAAVGGPLVRDRFWFFGSGRVARNRTGVSRSAQVTAFLRALAPGFEPFDNAWDGDVLFAKVSGQISRRHQALFSYTTDVTTLGGAQPNETDLFREIVVGGPGYFGRLSSVWNSSLVFRVAVGYNGRKQQNRNVPENVTGINVHERVFADGGRLIGTGAIAALDASPFAGIDFDVNLWTISADATYFRTGGWGTHELQAGVYLQPRRRNRWITRYNNGGAQLEEVVLRDPANPVAGFMPFHRVFSDTSALTTHHVNTRDTAVYLQDAWRVGRRLTINAGVRVDWIRRDDQLFGLITQDSTEIGPRFGANYMLTPRDGLRVSWGRVHENLTQNEPQLGTAAAGMRETYDPALDGTFPVEFVTPPQRALTSNLVIDRERYHQPYIHELIAGYRRQFGDQVSVDVSVSRREYHDRPTAVETNGMYASTGAFAGYRDEGQNAVYTLTSNRWNWPVSNAVHVQVSKQTSRLQVIAGYMREWNHLAGTWQPNDPASFIQPEAFPNRNGIGFVNGCTSASVCPDANSLSPGFGGGTWRNHVGSIGLVYQAPWQLRLATSYNVQSGPWSGPILTRLPAPDPRFGLPTVTLSNGRIVSNPLATTVRFAHATRGEGQFRLPALHLWNLRVSRSFTISDRRIEAAVSVFNLTNHDADQQVQPGANQEFSPFFRQGSSRQFTRAAQISFRLVF